MGKGEWVEFLEINFKLWIIWKQFKIYRFFYLQGLVFLGLSILYIKILNSSKNIRLLNKRIEKEMKNLNSVEIKNIKGGLEFNLDDSEERKEKRKIQHKIEKLRREKKYILEQISIYKIFKK